MMKMILHDWNDEECMQILSNIYRAAPQNGRVFVIEHVIPDPDIPHFSKLFDIHMLVMLTGRRGPPRNMPGCSNGLAGSTSRRGTPPPE